MTFFHFALQNREEFVWIYKILISTKRTVWIVKLRATSEIDIFFAHKVTDKRKRLKNANMKQHKIKADIKNGTNFDLRKNEKTKQGKSTRALWQ